MKKLLNIKIFFIFLVFLILFSLQSFASTYTDLGGCVIKDFFPPPYQGTENSYVYCGGTVFLFNSNKVQMRYVRNSDESLGYANRHVIRFYTLDGTLVSYNDSLEKLYFRCFEPTYEYLDEVYNDNDDVRTISSWTEIDPITFAYDIRNYEGESIPNPFLPGAVKSLISNRSVYSYDGSTVFFQGAPPKVEQVTIPAITQVEEIPQAMEEVLKILIPVGLIVFGIGLVIFLMRLVISRVT